MGQASFYNDDTGMQNVPLKGSLLVLLDFLRMCSLSAVQ